MMLPKMLSDQLKGNRLAVASKVVSTTGDLSLVGPKMVVLTDYPAVYLHDTGGILGNERVLELKNLSSESADLAFADKGKSLRGRIEFAKGIQALFEVKDKIAEIADSVPVTLAEVESDVLFETPIPVGVRCQFTAKREELEAQVDQRDPHILDRLKFNGWSTLYEKSYLEKPDICALAEHLVEEEFLADVVMTRHRLQLKKRKEILADVPLALLDAEQVGSREFRFTGELLVIGHPVTSISIQFPSNVWARRMSQALAECRRTAAVVPVSGKRGLVEAVRIQGRLGEGNAVNERMDAVLTEEALELRSLNGDRSRCTFRFNDPEVCVAGTNERFIIAGPENGPVVVFGGADRFRSRLVESQAVRTVAQRTLAKGPCLCMWNEEPVRCRTTDDGLEILGPSVKKYLPFDIIRSVQRDVADKEEAVAMQTRAKETFRFVGEQNLLQAFATRVRTGVIAADFSDRPRDAIGTIVGLERDYFVYTIFGPLYEVHAIVGEQFGNTPVEREISVPESVSDKANFATILAKGIDSLRKHLDKVLYHLPSLLLSWDAELCKSTSVSPVWLKAQERNYRATFMGIQPVVAELKMLYEMLVRIEGIESRLEAIRPNYGGVIISLAGALINPFCLISAGQQAWSASNHATRMKADQTETLQTIVQRACRQWNYLLLELIPALSHHVLDGLFPMRLDMYNQLQQPQTTGTPEVKKALALRIARRLSILVTFLQYPESETSQYVRGKISQTIRQLRESLTPGLLQQF